MENNSLKKDELIVVDGHKTVLDLGDTLVVKPNQWHKFHTLHGAVVEEVSTTHINNDSYYEDPKISSLSRDDRKTKVDNWSEYFRKKIAI